MHRALHSFPTRRSSDLMLRSQNLPIASLKHDIASCFTVTGAKINDLVGGAHHARFMLYDHDRDRKSTRLNSSHRCISYAVFCLKKKKKTNIMDTNKSIN